MKTLLNVLAGAVLALVCFSGAQAQTFPCGPSFFYYGAVPSTGTWENCFASLQASLGFTPLNKAGDSMVGALGVVHVFGASGTPVMTPGAGAGTGGTVTPINAFDSDFGLSVLTGTSPTGSNATIATVTFSLSYPLTAPHCTFSATNSNAAALNAAAQPFSTFTPGPPYTAWVLKSGGTALSAATTYTWDVICFG